MSASEVLEALSLTAEKPSEEQLGRSDAALCEAIVDGAGAVTATLAEIAEDNLGRTLTGTVIWSELDRRFRVRSLNGCGGGPRKPASSGSAASGLGGAIGWPSDA